MKWLTEFSASKVHACLPILEILAKQVQTVRARMESSVLETCERFKAMASNTNQMIQLAVGSGKKKASGAELIENTRSQILDLINNMNFGNEIIANIRTDVLRLRGQLESVHKTLTQMERISGRARIVALNGQIEAVNAGESGAAFSEVADQTRALASNVQGLSENIRESIDRFSSQLQEVAQRTSEHAEQSTAKVAEKTEAAHVLLNQLEGNQNRLENNLVEATGLGKKLSRDISRAVTLLQFQDEVNQQLDHVVAASDEVRNVIGTCLEGEPTSEGRQFANELLTKLESMYTMASERVNSGNNSEAIPQESAIELF